MRNRRIKSLVDFVRRLRQDGVTGLAAMLAYNFFLVIPAALIFMVTVLSFLPIRNLGQRITDQMQNVLPASSLSLLKETIHNSLHRAGGRGIILTTSLLGALYVMNSGYAGLISSLNRVHRLQEKRRWLRVRLRALIMSMFAAGFILMALSLALLAPPLIRHFSARTAVPGLFADVLSLSRWLLITFLALTGMETTYRFAPCGGRRRGPVSPGAVFATGAWLVATLGFAFYVNHFGAYDRIYGGLGAVIVTLVWIWMSAMVFLVGAEINALWEERSGLPKRVRGGPEL